MEPYKAQKIIVILPVKTNYLWVSGCRLLKAYKKKNKNEN